MSQLLTILLFSLLSLLRSNETVQLTFVGDAMQHGPQINAARQADGSFDYSQCFTLVENDIASADYAVANLECPLGGKPYSGYPQFSAPNEYAMQLKKSGFDLLLTANNHCMDRGAKGARSTIANLDSMGIPHIGTYTNAKARENLMPFIVKVKNAKIAFLSYTYGTNGLPVTDGVVVNNLNRKVMAADIAKARKAGADFVCMCLHWGEEYHLLPLKSQKDLADFLSDQGVDMVIGSHPHVIEPMEIRTNKLGKRMILAYSLGNFISNQNDIDSRGGAMVKVWLRPDAQGSLSVSDASYKIFFCQKPINRKENYKLIPASKPDEVRPDSRSAFDSFVSRARDIFKKHNINVDEEE